jgi:hypothetical protein
MSTVYRTPDQYIQPWEYGHGETKKNVFVVEESSVIEANEYRPRKGGSDIQMGPSLIEVRNDQ